MDVEKREAAFSPEALKEKYRLEREKRLRADGSTQYAELSGLYADFDRDPYVEPGFTRPAVTEEIDVLVVCHGDACCPNTLIGDDGVWIGHVDFGQLGLGDRWADIAVASWSTEWNYGPGWEDALIDAYGVEPDRERLAYYRALWDAT